MSKGRAARVCFGMAGEIYTGGTGPHADEDTGSWIAAQFATTASTTAIEWRGADMVIFTFQHANEVRAAPGRSRRTLPATDTHEGLVFGQFFAVPSPSMDSGALSGAVLENFRAAGIAAFRSINGTWVSVVWDRKQREARFVRDGLGVLTLYAAPLPDRIVFSTDLRVLQSAGLLGGLDEQGAAEFLHYLYVPAPRTIAVGCHAVLPGHVLTIAGGSPRQQHFAAPRFVEGAPLLRDQHHGREVEARLPEFEQRLLTAVADCLPPTGRIALTLSGGKDSSTLAVALSKLCPDRVLALNVGALDRRVDESHDARLVCEALGLRFQLYTPSDEALASGLYEFARAQDQPWGDPAALPYYLAMAQLPDDCTVVLDGTGNDYYFGIPSRQKGIDLYQRRKQVQRWLPGPLWKLFITTASFGPRTLRQVSKAWDRPVEETFVSWEGWSASELSRLLRREVSFADTHLWRVMREGAHDPWIELLTNVICSVWEPHTAYRKAVQFAHAAGRVIRFPFTDNRLAHFVNDLPTELKFRNGINKQLLRAYMAANLPAEIVNKPKSGFIFDLNRVLMNPRHGWLEQLERGGLLKVVARWSDRPIHELLARYRAAPHDARWQHRLYALCLLATVLAVKDGYEPDLRLRA